MRRLLLVAVLLLAGCGSDDGGDGSAAGGDAVQLTAKDYEFDQSTINVDAAGETTFTLTNDGDSQHALEIEGNGVEEETDTIDPGGSASVTVALEPGEYEFYCPVENHRSLGMEGKLVVGGAASSSSGGGTSTGRTDTDDDGGYGYGG
jgi:plastocyanin